MLKNIALVAGLSLAATQVAAQSVSIPNTGGQLAGVNKNYDWSQRKSTQTSLDAIVTSLQGGTVFWLLLGLIAFGATQNSGGGGGAP